MCGTCGFSTHTKSAMIRHNLSHTGEKPHICEMCGSAYADKKRLRDHQVSQHTDVPGYDFSIPTYGCDFCGFSSRRKDNLRAHVRRVHPELSGEHRGSSGIGSDQRIQPILPSGNTTSLSRSSSEVMGSSKNILNIPKTEETKPDIRIVPSSILKSPNKMEKSFVNGVKSRSNTNIQVTYNSQEISSTNRFFDDRSHIVGHINHDGSIRPVASATPSYASVVNDDQSFQQSSNNVIRVACAKTSDAKAEGCKNSEQVQSSSIAQYVSNFGNSEDY